MKELILMNLFIFYIMLTTINFFLIILLLITI